MHNDIPFTRASQAALANAVQENLFALFRLMSTLPGSELEEGEKLSRHLTFPSNPMYKGVWRTQLEKEELQDAIQDTIEWFKKRKAPFFFWWTGPGTTPSDLDQALMANGLISMAEQMNQLAAGIRSTEMGAPGMIADLHQMNEAALLQVPAGFTMEDVQDEQSLSEFKGVLIEGYDVPAAMADGWVQAARSFGIRKTPWRMVLGRLDGKPVASNIIVKGGGVAGAFGVATIPAARGKGIGGAITLKPLLDTRDEGYHYAVLFSSDMAVHAYERIGFQPCGIRINRYLWREQQK